MGQRPNRQTIRLRDYDYSTPAAYFVTICTAARRPFFDDHRLRYLAEEAWAKLPGRYASVALDAFVVMPNHIHFVLHLKETEAMGRRPALSDVIAAYKSTVAVEWLRYCKSRGRQPPARTLW
jgi:REP element-mobilizing transposase RayT